MKTTNTNETNNAAIRLMLMAGDHFFAKAATLAASIDANGETPEVTAKLEGLMLLYRANRANLEALANNGEPINGHHEVKLRLTLGLYDGDLETKLRSEAGL